MSTVLGFPGVSELMTLPNIFSKLIGYWIHFQKMNKQAAIHSVGRTTNICLHAGCEKSPKIAHSGLSASLGAQVNILTSLGSCGGLSGEIARSSGISEKVDEKDRLSAVNGGCC